MAGQPDTYNYTYTFNDIPIAAASLNIDVATQRPRYVTFRVRPQVLPAVDTRP